MHTSASIHINAAPGSAWGAVLDFAGRMKHSSRLKGAEVVGGGELVEGARLRLKIDNDSFTMRVVDVRAPEKLALEFRGPLMRGGHAYTVSGDDGGAVVRIDAEYGGLLGSVFGALTKGKVQRDLRDELEAIKAQAEEPGD